MKKIQLFKPWMIWPADLKRGRYTLLTEYDGDFAIAGWRFSGKNKQNESLFALYWWEEGEFMDWQDLPDE